MYTDKFKIYTVYIFYYVCIISIYIYVYILCICCVHSMHIPVVPHKAVAEVSE